MDLEANTASMLSIASLISQKQMRRSLTGALATDPIVPEHPGRRSRPTPARTAKPKHLGDSLGRHTTHPDEGAQHA